MSLLRLLKTFANRLNQDLTSNQFDTLDTFVKQVLEKKENDFEKKE